MKNSRVGRRYAQALMMTAESTKAIDQLAGDLETIKQLFDADRTFRLFVNSPVVPAEKKMLVFREIFGKKIGKASMEFLEMITHKGREHALPVIVDQFLALRDEKYGIVNVDVSSAVEITKQQQESLTAKLEQFTRKKVRIRFSQDKALQGGLMVRIGDTVLDASVKHQLEVMRERFAHGHALN